MTSGQWWPKETTSEPSCVSMSGLFAGIDNVQESDADPGKEENTCEDVKSENPADAKPATTPIKVLEAYGRRMEEYGPENYRLTSVSTRRYTVPSIRPTATTPGIQS